MISDHTDVVKGWWLLSCAFGYRHWLLRCCAVCVAMSQHFELWEILFGKVCGKVESVHNGPRKSSGTALSPHWLIGKAPQSPSVLEGGHGDMREHKRPPRLKVYLTMWIHPLVKHSPKYNGFSLWSCPTLPLNPSWMEMSTRRGSSEWCHRQTLFFGFTEKPFGRLCFVMWFFEPPKRCPQELSKNRLFEAPFGCPTIPQNRLFWYQTLKLFVYSLEQVFFIGSPGNIKYKVFFENKSFQLAHYKDQVCRI